MDLIGYPEIPPIWISSRDSCSHCEKSKAKSHTPPPKLPYFLIIYEPVLATIYRKVVGFSGSQATRTDKSVDFVYMRKLAVAPGRKRTLHPNIGLELDGQHNFAQWIVSIGQTLSLYDHENGI